MENTQKVRLWNPKTTANLSCLFSPMFGALILSKNWKELNEPGKAKIAIRWAYLNIILIICLEIVLMFLNPEINLFLIVEVPYLIVWYIVECSKQAEYIKAKLNNDYEKKPWGGAILKGVGIVALILVLHVIASAIGSPSEKVIIEKSAVPIVNTILKDVAIQSGHDLPKCLNVKIYEELAKDCYKAKATLSNAEKVELIITKKEDMIIVRIAKK